MATKKRNLRTLTRWIRRLGACNGAVDKYAGKSLEQAWRIAAQHDEQEWIVEQALGIKHSAGFASDCWCTKPKGKFKRRVFGKFKSWQRTPSPLGNSKALLS